MSGIVWHIRKVGDLIFGRLMNVRRHGRKWSLLNLELKLSELGPPNENLLRHAGHTPMAIIDVDDSRR
jgi:hypothetical protein